MACLVAVRCLSAVVVVWLGLAACGSTRPPPSEPAAETGAVGAACGGLALLPPCASGTFCLREACGMNDQSGRCVARPEVCTRDFAPVCGCDGQTYPNRCNASAAGTNVSADGPCPGGDER